MNVLLDTCCFIWLALNTGKLSRAASAIIDDDSHTLFLSDVSVWEICLKFTSGRLSLPLEPAEWLPSRREFFGLQPLKIDESAILLTALLPQVHTDPFDRLIAAQAIENQFTILSPDRPLSLLGASRLW